MVLGQLLAELQHMWARSQAPANALFARSPRARHSQRTPLQQPAVLRLEPPRARRAGVLHPVRLAETDVMLSAM